MRGTLRGSAAWDEGYMTEVTAFIAIVVPVVVATVAWLLNERSRRGWEEYRRKEERYRVTCCAVSEGSCAGARTSS